MNQFTKHKLRHYQLVSDKLMNVNNGNFLDYGTGNAEFIGNMLKGKRKLYAFDVDTNNIAAAKRKYPKVKFTHFPVGNKLKYKSNYFDYVFMFHVLEHVDSEVNAISEISRVLKKGGILYLASPYKGLFSWADPANIRYRFPELHRLAIKLILGDQEYDKRFRHKKKINMFGDCSDNRTWHVHYKEKDLQQLLKKDFIVNEFKKFSLIHPFLIVLNNICDYLFGKESVFIKNLISLDNNLEAGELSYNFLLKATKK